MRVVADADRSDVGDPRQEDALPGEHVGQAGQPLDVPGQRGAVLPDERRHVTQRHAEVVQGSGEGMAVVGQLPGHVGQVRGERSRLLVMRGELEVKAVRCRTVSKRACRLSPNVATMADSW